MITFVHTADIHFGMENYGKIDPKTGIHSRLLDFEASLNKCIDFAIEKKVDFFLFAGDAYKTAMPTPTQQKLLMKCFFRLHSEAIPVVIVVGNHDNPLSFGKINSLELFANLPLTGFHVFSKPGLLNLKTKSGVIQIVGIPWPNRHNLALNNFFYSVNSTELTRHISESLSKIIKDFSLKLDKNLPAILTSHCTVSSGVFSGSEKRAIYGNDPILLPSELALAPFNYVALGHLHRFQNLNSDNQIPVVYSGSIDRVDFGERNEDKGFCFVKIKKNITFSAEFEFIKLNTREFIQIDATLSSSDFQTEELIAIIKQYKISDSILKITYKLPVDLIDKVDLRRIQAVCMSAQSLVSLIPIRTVIVRERRAFVSNKMDLETLLRSYFDSKENLKNRAELLTEKALQLCCKEEAQ